MLGKSSGWEASKGTGGNISGGLKKEIVSTIRMFKPKTLHDAIELAWMRDDNLSKDR
jgi:hypothetical protein